MGLYSRHLTYQIASGNDVSTVGDGAGNNLCPGFGLFQKNTAPNVHLSARATYKEAVEAGHRPLSN